MILTWNGKKLDWVNVSYFAAIHVAALWAPFHFSWSAFGVFFFLWWLTGSIGICLTYHRLLTHRGFKVPKPLEYLLTVCGMLASEGGAILWVARHRYHHLFSDRPRKDIHTPKDGFWWSHMGWILCKIDLEDRDVERQYAPELVADPVHRVLNRAHIVPNILVGLALYAWAGWGMVVWGVFLRMVVNLHATWFVNSAAHTFGYRTFDTPEGSTNCWWVGLIAWGEGWHNNHHAFQRSARHGHEWWELDTTWMVIRALAAMGLARDIQLLPATADRFRLDRTTTLGAPGLAQLPAEPLAEPA
ncbi:MAG TPA: fatty acid desaturase, partial [Vicinamibacteria bacterium]|nr:fatty acid desaturase [Vicinamibacteria bacterium]